MSYYIHETPGRLRIRTPMVKNDAARATVATELLRGLAGVRSVLSNPATGSITVTYFPHVLCPSDVINRLARAGFLEGIVGFPRHRAAAGLTRQPAPPSFAPPAPLRKTPPALRLATLREATAVQKPLLSPGTVRALKLAAKLVLPILAERAFGRTGKALVDTLL